MGIFYFLLFGFLFLLGLQVFVWKYWTPEQNHIKQRSKDLNLSKKRVIINDYGKFVEDCDKPKPPVAPVIKTQPNGYYYTKRRGKRKTGGISHLKR